MVADDIVVAYILVVAVVVVAFSVVVLGVVAAAGDGSCGVLAVLVAVASDVVASYLA